MHSPLSNDVRLMSTVLFCLVLLASLVQAQNRRPPASGNQTTQSNIRSGKLIEVQTKGRLRTLIIEEDDGTRHEVRLTPKIQFAVTGPGDKGFLQVGQFITGKGVLTNEQLFLSEVTVYLLPKGKRPPLGKYQKAPKKEGESVNTYLISGAITAVGPDKDYSDYTRLALKTSGRVPPIFLDKNFKLKISSSDISHAPDGASVQMLVRPLRGGRVMPMRIKIDRTEPFKSEEILGEKKKS